MVGLVSWRAAVPDRAPPLPSFAPPQPAQGLPAGAALMPRAWLRLPLPLLLPGTTGGSCGKLLFAQVQVMC